MYRPVKKWSKIRGQVAFDVFCVRGLCTGTLVTPRNTPHVPPCRICHSRSHGIGITRGSQSFGALRPRPLGYGACLATVNTPLPQMCYHTKFRRRRSNGTTVYIQGDLPDKFGPSRPASQGQWRSSELTWFDRATYDFMLVIHSDHGHVLFCFLDKGRFRSKIANSS